MSESLTSAAAAGSLVLVAVTIWYAWQTQQMVREMRRGRVEAVRPCLRLDLGGVYGASTLEIANLGVGPAVDVSVELVVFFDGDETQREGWTTPLLRSGDSRTMLMPNKDGVEGSFAPAQYWADHDTRIQMAGRCRDLDGRIHKIEDSLSFASHATRGVEGSWAGVEDRLPTNVEKLAKELAAIRKALERRSSGV